MAYRIHRPMLNDAEEVVSLSKRISDRYVENIDEWKKASENKEEFKRYIVARLASYPKIAGYACVRPDIPRQPGLSRVRLSGGKDLEFFTKLGFAEYETMLQLRLDVANIEVCCLDSLIEEQNSKGITISTLDQELKQSPDAFNQLYELEKKLFKIFPSTDPVIPMSFEAFLDNLNRIKDIQHGYFIAKDRNTYIGCSYLTRKATDQNGLAQGLTGVVSHYQNRGIATALKYCTIQYAKQNNFQYIETGSLSTNKKMLSIQQKVGFKIESSELRLEKKI